MGKRKETEGQRERDSVRERKEEAISVAEREIWTCCLLHCERYLSISIKLQWWRVASAWGIVWDQLNLQVPANLMTPPKFNHATRAREDLTSTKWHTGVSTPANRVLYEHHVIPQCLAQQDIRVLMCRLAPINVISSMTSRSWRMNFFFISLFPCQCSCW